VVDNVTVLGAPS